MIKAQYIKLNMTPSGVMPVLYCSQYDIGRPLGLVVYDGSDVVDLSTYTCTIEATRTDGTAITAGVTTEGNIGAFVTTATMTNQADKYPAKLVIVDGSGNRVASIAFVLCITPATMDENAESIEEDKTLYQQYTETVQTLIAAVRSNLVTETNRAKAAESTLQANINSEASTRAAAVTAETNRAKAAEIALQNSINSEASARARADSNLQSQINQIVAPSGSAPSAAEVENARIGADGITYSSLGNAIRTQVTNLQNDLTLTNNSIGVAVKNLRLLYTPLLNGACHINGTTNTSNAHYKHLEYVLSGERYLYITGNPYSQQYPLWFFLDSSGNTIKYPTYSGGSAYIADELVEVPPNAYKVIVNGADWNNQNNAIKTYDDTIRSNLESISADRIICSTDYIGTRTSGYSRRVNGTDTTVENGEYLSADLLGGESLILSGYNFADASPAFLIYAGETLIYKGNFGNSGTRIDNVYLKMPPQATKIYVNGFLGSYDNGYYAPAIIKKYTADVTLEELYPRIKKRKYAFIGDSYLQGYSHDDQNSGWGIYLAEDLGLTTNDYIRAYKGGARFSYANGNTNTFSALVTAQAYDEDVTDVVVCGGYNDVSYTTSNVLYGIINFCYVCKLRFPNAKIHIGFIAWNKAGNGEGAVDNWESIHTNLLNRILPAYQACTLYSSYSAHGCSYMSNVEYWINDASLTDSDGYHPNENGNRLLARAIANALLTGSAPMPYNGDLRLS